VEELKKFDRVIAILIQLQSKKIITANELAKRFQVSTRTVYRDIHTLQMAGVPIMGETGTGYSILESYKVAPTAFTYEEISSLVTAQKMMEFFSDENQRQSYASLVMKVRSLLRWEEKIYAVALEQNISFSGGQIKINDKIPNVLSIIFESIAKKRCSHISYKKADAVLAEIRKIEVVGMFFESNFWYLYAFCHLRKDYRQFRCDRIFSISLLDEAFSRIHPLLDNFLTEKKIKTPRRKVILKCSNSIAGLLHWDRDCFGFTHEEILKEHTIMHFETALLYEGFDRWFMMFGDEVEIVEPLELKEIIRTRIVKQLENLER
jgi:predicted DNA-binding transcriptional regulator YafY